jgi:NDP-4-keto-2,6-dideoxyhexose 3-C-methyltransferase
MFYDLEDPNTFVADVAGVLAADGVWVVEVGWLTAMLQQNSFDAICHEHLEYYAFRQLEAMLGRVGLAVQRAETNGINGGSICLFIRPVGACRRSADDEEGLAAIRARERELGLDTDRPYRDLRVSAETIRSDLRRLLQEIAMRGERVYAYGASTKGNVILQYCGLDRRLVAYAADRNPDKWGYEMLGTEIPIISEEDARADAPEYFLVLPYHFLEEFKRRESDYLARGGKFILPMPAVRVIGAGQP